MNSAMHEALFIQNPTFVWIVVAVFGACVGSFLNVVIHRVPRGESIVTPPSACPKCQRRLRPWENVPVVGWLALRGRCAGCRESISPRYPLIETAGALLALGCLWQFGLSLHALLSFALLAAMLAVALIDWEWMIIPDGISLGFLALGLAASPWSGPGILASVVGAVIGGGLLLVVGVLWEKLRGVEAMGGGDIKLMAAVGAFLGAIPALLVIFIGAFLGAIVGVILMRREGQARIAFGTFLAAATLVVVFVGQPLIDWYTSLLLAGG
jgi:leader peptidase (prepilin peptidase) / N-methyltransferase